MVASLSTWGSHIKQWIHYGNGYSLDWDQTSLCNQLSRVSTTTEIFALQTIECAGCYKVEMYGAMELIKPCPSHVMCRYIVFWNTTFSYFWFLSVSAVKWPLSNKKLSVTRPNPTIYMILERHHNQNNRDARLFYNKLQLNQLKLKWFEKSVSSILWI